MTEMGQQLPNLSLAAARQAPQYQDTNANSGRVRFGPISDIVSRKDE